MTSLQKPGDVAIVPRLIHSEATIPVSSSSSRLAHTKGSSPASNLPAGISNK